VGLVLGPFHVEHVFISDPSAPYASRERISRPGEADLIQVTTNMAFPDLTSDLPAWACHNVAEALALELGSADDFVETKSRLWAAITAQPGIARASDGRRGRQIPRS
jgi:hypothetical protein